MTPARILNIILKTIWASGGAGEALGRALGALEAPMVTGMVRLYTVAPLCNGMHKLHLNVDFTVFVRVPLIR